MKIIIITCAIVWIGFAICTMSMTIMVMWEVMYTNRMARKVKRATLKEYLKSRRDK